MRLWSTHSMVERSWGFARGTYTLRLVPRDGGEPIVEAGRYIDVLEKGTDGAWRIARAIWNTTES